MRRRSSTGAQPNGARSSQATTPLSAIDDGSRTSAGSGSRPSLHPAEALVRLHLWARRTGPLRDHVDPSGEGWDVDSLASTRRVAHERRGGYCFHLNGAFSELLWSLGYDVTRHVGGVHGPDGPEDALTNHLVLTVQDFPPTTTRRATGMSTPGSATRCTSRCRFGRRRSNRARSLLSLEPRRRRGRLASHPRPQGLVRGHELARPRPAWTTSPSATWLSTSPESGFVRI